jgi:alpha-glucosidase
VDEYEAAMPADASPNWVLGNHDRHRLATRVGAEQARVAAMLLLTLRGTPTCYYGDELGLENVPIPPEMVQDPPAVNQPEIAHIVGRDPERTPMQWDTSPHAGFSSPDSKNPWLPLAANYKEVNVARQLEDPRSMLNFYRRLLALRRTSPALQVGLYRPVELSGHAAQHCFVYERRTESQKVLVALNFSNQEQTLELPQAGNGIIALSTSLGREDRAVLSSFKLHPNEGCIIILEGDQS